MLEQNRESWKLINEITGHKSAPKGILVSATKEERLKKWETHFSNLLWKEPMIERYDHEDIPAVFIYLDINDRLFKIEE